MYKLLDVAISLDKLITYATYCLYTNCIKIQSEPNLLCTSVLSEYIPGVSVHYYRHISRTHVKTDDVNGLHMHLHVLS